MPLLTTSFDPALGQTDIVFEIGDPAMEQGEQIVDYLENAVAQGTRFSAGESIQLGWGHVQIREGGDGYLELFEPDFRSSPIGFVNGLRGTLRHLLLQRYAAEALGVEPDFPSLRLSGLTSPEFFANPREFVLEREAVDPGTSDSGWVFLAPDDPRGKNAKLHSLYAVALAQPRVIPFMALPPGCCVTLTAESILVEYLDRRVSSAENEFLAALLKT